MTDDEKRKLARQAIEDASRIKKNTNTVLDDEITAFDIAEEGSFCKEKARTIMKQLVASGEYEEDKRKLNGHTITIIRRKK